MFLKSRKLKLKGKQLDTLALIVVYLFLGHSLMEGGCTHDAGYSWLYGEEKGFYWGNSSEPVVAFLRDMRFRYPDSTRFTFCGAVYNQAAMMITDMVPGQYFYDKMMRAIRSMKNQRGKRVVIGGIVLMFGFVEGQDRLKAENLGTDYLRLISRIRNATGNNYLPCIVCRYEENNLRDSVYAKYRKYEKTVIREIASLESRDRFIKISPIRPIPKEYYCEDHHWIKEGYWVWADDGTALIQINHFDFWNTNK